MPLLYLGLGSNQGSRWERLAQARACCQQRLGPLKRLSPIYTTTAWGLTEQPAFLNQVISLTTEHPAEDCLTIALAIEEQLGRQRRQKWGPREIDIDLLFYDDLQLQTPTLTLPHPYIPERMFVLRPLADIAQAQTQFYPEITLAELLANCPDTSPVELYHSL